MQCDSYLLELYAMCGILALLAVGGLVYTAIRARRAVLGDLLLEACAGDYQTAVLAIENVKAENELMATMIAKDIPRTSETRH